MSTIRICPSILAADLLTLREQAQAAERGADRFQVDVMDGMFVPNISFGFPLVETMRRATTLLLEAHLMIVQPDRYLNEFAQAGADLIIVHQEATVHLDRSIQYIKHLGKKAGVAICPSTPVNALEVVKEHAASAAPSGHGRRPQPRFLSSRLRFCPAALISASPFTRQSRRRRKRLMPCQSLPSAKSGSTHTLRLRIAC